VFNEIHRIQKEEEMNEHLNNLSNKISAARHNGQLPEIRKLFNLYLENLETDDPDKTLQIALIVVVSICLFVGVVII
jgi:hypothetical protein